VGRILRRADLAAGARVGRGGYQRGNCAVFGVVGKASPAISHISHRRLESRRTRRVRPPMVERTAV